ncbi:MAG: YdeI/OmpD-associated family protein [Cyclobacteriaceae bacterium]
MPVFFPTPDSFRKWLDENYGKESELWVGYYKKGTGKQSITWPESVDQALCFGWIDGLRKRIDDEAYMIRFTPRKPGSHWSHVNIGRMKELKKNGLVTEAGLLSFQKRTSEKTSRASYEQGKIELSTAYKSQIEKNPMAWEFFTEKLTPSFRKQSIWWVMSAKKEETRLRRLNVLIESSEKGKLIPPLKWTKNQLPG